MTRASSVFRAAFGVLAAGAACAVLSVPVANAQEDPAPEPSPTPAAAPAPTDDCTASTLAQTVSSVTASLSEYFAAHPDANQAMIDITRQPAFVAIGQMDGYFGDHPDQADAIRGIQAPLAAFKDRCGLEVSPTDALAALAEV